MTESQRKQAEQILKTLTRQKFSDWYNERFESYVRADHAVGDLWYISEEDILTDITKIFNIK
jgi:hypothetical protein